MPRSFSGRQERRRLGVAERHRHDAAAVRRRVGRPASSRPRRATPGAARPARGFARRWRRRRSSSKTERAASFPMAASQLIELSKREAVGERSIVGPKKLSNGTRPAFQPALTGMNRSCIAAGEVAVPEPAPGVHQELVIGGGQHVDRGEIAGHGECADELRAVDEHDRADRARDRADRRDVGTVAGRGLHPAERDQHGPGVDVLARCRRVRARRCGTEPGERRSPSSPGVATGSGSSCTRARRSRRSARRSAGPNCAATSPAAADTEAINATSDGSAPIRAATAARACSPAASPRA